MPPMGMTGTVGLVAVVVVGLVGCGSGGGSPAASGLDANAPVRTLTESEVRTLCDWVAETGGGYGHVTTCDGGLTIRAKANQQACVDSLKQTAQCTATVRDVETCSMTAARNPCDLSAFASPACASVLTCN